MMIKDPNINWAASGHCDYLFKVENKEIWKTTTGFQWPYVGDAYLWVLH